MKYQVIITPEAQAGIRDSFAYIHERSPSNAARWLQALYKRIDTERCAFAREREYLDEDLRQLVFKSHRIVFAVATKEMCVHVVYVRHASRRAVGEPTGDDSQPLAVIRAAAPVRRTISQSIALAAAHEKETGQAPVLDPDFAADVDQIVRNRRPWNPPSWD